VTPESCFLCAVDPSEAPPFMWANAEIVQRPATRGDIVGGVLEIAGLAVPVGRGGGKIVGESATVLGRAATLSEGAVATAARVEGAAARAEGPAARAANLVERVIGGGCGSSFAEATPVTTSEGLKPIGELKPGDRVLARDEVTGAYAFEPITEVFRHQDSVKVYLTLEDPATGATEVIETTPNHPFHMPGHGFVEAADLKSGDPVSQLSMVSTVRLTNNVGDTAGALRVKALTFEDKPFSAYNLEVAEHHTFFVGKGYAWVHNGCAPRVGGGAKLENLTPGEIRRIQNAANRTGTQITVVGSRARGTTHALSDWDYVVPAGTKGRTIHSLASSLPEGPRLGLGQARKQDFFKGVVDETRPFITFTPASK